ncbi:MAG: hypothetical protein C7B45_05555 [Sulfobacillus acidophilus]|uniref:Type II toxin-antitoxin system HicA family toxin n=1 Tax=Sulfobacillus acidophilus TaxID=53633 RepID=A0A2T2WKL7_9FIRM|nr:MAG: hypothetical protein C7B45_05555 [Sulfobacillus acidophilus]
MGIRWPFLTDLVGVSFKGLIPENGYSLHQDFDAILILNPADTRITRVCDTLRAGDEVTGPEVVRKLQKLGFVVDHVTGSHVILIGSDGQRTVVPVHGARALRRGTLHAICNQVGVTEEQMRRL